MKPGFLILLLAALMSGCISEKRCAERYPGAERSTVFVLERMKQIGNDIIARMLHDHMKCELLTLKAIPGFNINSVSYEMLGPVFDNDYGAMYSFKLLDCVGLEYDPSKWNMFL